jgi:hypothetical protein
MREKCLLMPLLDVPPNNALQLTRRRTEACRDW